MIQNTLGAGQRIGDRYEIRRLLGSGGMADVYLAWDCRLMREIALKILRLDPSFDAEHASQQKERLLREARAAARLNHPGIVVIHDLGETGDLPFISMEYIEGRNLRDIQNHFLARGNTMPVFEMLNIARQVAAALDYAHEQTVIHRDIKPENIMITPDCVCKITDFGIARSQVAGLRTLTPHGRLACTFHYAAPEYFRCEPASSRGDQFSFGCVLYELLTGRFAFSAEEEHQVWYRITHLNPVPPGDLVFELPEAVNAIVLKMLAKHPEERFRSCREAVTALETALEDLPGSHVFQVTPMHAAPELSTPGDADQGGWDTGDDPLTGTDTAVMQSPTPATGTAPQIPIKISAPTPGSIPPTAESARPAPDSSEATQVLAGRKLALTSRRLGSALRRWWMVAGIIAGLMLISAFGIRWPGKRTDNPESMILQSTPHMETYPLEPVDNPFDDSTVEPTIEPTVDPSIEPAVDPGVVPIIVPTSATSSHTIPLD